MTQSKSSDFDEEQIKIEKILHGYTSESAYDFFGNYNSYKPSNEVFFA